MDYQAACARLDTPRKKDSKILGHKLTLYYDGLHDGDDGKTHPLVRLQYFRTNIITWRHDGVILIDGGEYWDSQCTRDKITEYLPRGWRMFMQRLKYVPQSVAAYITIRSDTWEFIRSMPYKGDTKYTAEGRIDAIGTSLHDLDASTVIGHVEETVFESVMAYLRGELPKPAIRDDVTLMDARMIAGIETRDQCFNPEMVRIALARKPEPGLVYHVIERYIGNYRRRQLKFFAPEIFPYSKPSRTEKHRLEKLELQMKIGHFGDRYARNTEEFHTLKKDLLEQCELFLLQQLGFEVKSFQRRSRGHY